MSSYWLYKYIIKPRPHSGVSRRSFLGGAFAACIGQLVRPKGPSPFQSGLGVFTAPIERILQCKSAIRLDTGELLLGSGFKSINAPSFRMRELVFEPIEAREQFTVTSMALLDYDDRFIAEQKLRGGPQTLFNMDHEPTCIAIDTNRPDLCRCKLECQ